MEGKHIEEINIFPRFRSLGGFDYRRGDVDTHIYYLLLIDFPFLLCDIVIRTDDKLYGPDNQGEKDVHPSPPNL